MSKGTYVDGYLLVIPKKNASAYKKMAQEGLRIWKKFGALDYKECKLDQANPPMVLLTFPKLVKAKPTEDVWFSYVVFKSKAHRASVNKKVMAYFSKKYTPNTPMPFDMKRMSLGGFKVEVGA